MKDPDLTPLDPSIASLLGAEKARPGPDSAAREAVWSRLAAGLPLGPGPGGAPPASGSPAGDLPTSVAPPPTSVAPPPTSVAPPPTSVAPPPTSVAPPPTSVAPAPLDAARATSPATGPFTLVGSRAAGALAAMFVAGGITGAVLVASLRPPPPVTASLETPALDARTAPSGAPRGPGPLPETTAGAAVLPAPPPPDSLSPAPSVATERPASLSPSTGASASSGGTPPSSIGAPVSPSGAPVSPSGAPLASAASSAHRDVDLAAERSLLDEARAALARGEGGRCLTTLARHQSEFPGGRLSIEREVLTIQALVVSGRRAEAVSRAQAFRAAHPRSLLWPAVEASVGPVP